MPENKISILITYGFPLLLIGMGIFFFSIFRKNEFKVISYLAIIVFLFSLFSDTGLWLLKKFAFQDDYSAFIISDEQVICR